MTAALSELLATLATASSGGLDYIGGLFGVQRTATVVLDFAVPRSDGIIGTWRDVEPDDSYRERIVPVVKETAERAARSTSDPAPSAAMASVGQEGAVIPWGGRPAWPYDFVKPAIRLSPLPEDVAAEIRRRLDLRPDGFSQAAVDAAKAILLAPVKRRQP